MIGRGVSPFARAGHGDLAAHRLLRTARRCWRAEWFVSHVVEPKAVDEFADWLTGYGKGSRLDHIPAAQALDHFETVLEREHDAEFLAASLALPQLRKSSGIAMPERRACRP